MNDSNKPFDKALADSLDAGKEEFDCSDAILNSIIIIMSKHDQRKDREIRIMIAYLFLTILIVFALFMAKTERGIDFSALKRLPFREPELMVYFIGAGTFLVVSMVCLGAYLSRATHPLKSNDL